MIGSLKSLTGWKIDSSTQLYLKSLCSKKCKQQKKTDMPPDVERQSGKNVIKCVQVQRARIRSWGVSFFAYLILKIP